MYDFNHIKLWKMKLIQNDRKQTGGYLEGEVWVEAEGELTKKHKEIWGIMDNVHYLDYGDGFTGIYICQNLSNYTL